MKNKGLLIVTVVICLTLVLAVMPFVSACGGGGGGKTLKVGMTTPSTGKAAEKGSPMGHANLDAIKYINEELGGVAGYPIEVVWLDNAYDASKVVTNVKRFMDEGCILYTTASSAMMSASMEIANRAEFPGMA
ncbi:ABC transporter substrate-binding protein, partial [Chloroflexota bacterium]